MKQRPRIYYTEEQKALMWDRWQQGDSLHAIARLFDRHHPSIQRILAESGGIRPAPRRRSQRTLTLAEREEISRGMVAGLSLRTIAARLGRAPSTISREVQRNTDSTGTERIKPMSQRGSGQNAPRPVNWCRALCWHVSWPRSFSWSGRHNKSPAGSNATIPTTSTARCHTRPSIRHSLSRRVVP